MKLNKLLVASGLSLVLGCSAVDNSKVLTTSVSHTEVKSQLIGNCWLYAIAGWLESLWLSQNQEKIDVSESYWTYWHWYDQIVNSKISELETGGSWQDGQDLIRKYGWVLEADFAKYRAVPEKEPTFTNDPDKDKEYYQKWGSWQSSLPSDDNAHRLITESLKSGDLSKPENRTPENVRKALDKAFQVNMAAVETHKKDAAKLILKNKTGSAGSSVLSVINSWHMVWFPKTAMEQDAFMLRVKKALNDRQPVIMTFYVADSAMDVDTLLYSKLLEAQKAANGKPIDGGMHMVLLSDYTVKNLPEQFGEGEVNSEVKEAALQGQIKTLVAKNSWGTWPLEDGYLRFEYEYLTASVITKGPSTLPTTLRYMILPPGY